MAGKVLTTRPLEDAQRDISWLAENGIDAISAPMLDIKPLSVMLPDPDQFDAVVLTSRHAALQLADHHITALPCFCVGETTAKQARHAGFRTIITGPGDGHGLVEVILKSESQRIFWPAAVDTGFNIAAALEEHSRAVTRLAVYKAAEVDHFPEPVMAALEQGEVKVVLAHSGRAGAHFTRLLQNHGFAEALNTMTMIAISPRAAGLCGTDWHTIKIVDQPRRSAMLQAAREAMRQYEKEA